jgi:hypothetical protein
MIFAKENGISWCNPPHESVMLRQEKLGHAGQQVKKIRKIGKGNLRLRRNVLVSQESRSD